MTAVSLIARIALTMLVFAGVAIVSTGTTSQAAEAEAAWRFDAERSQIDFHLSAIGVIRLDGRFERFHGSIEQQDGASRVRLVVDAASLHMNNRRHRDWARSAEFFHVQEHPQIEFRSDPVPAGLLEHGGVLTGRLRVRGVERAARFRLAPGTCSSEQGCEIEVAGTILRSQYGMNSRRLALSDRVHLRMRFNMTRAAGQTTSDFADGN